MSDLSISGFQAFPSHRPKNNKKARRNSGGVILYIKESILHGVKVIKDDTPDVVWAILDKSYFGWKNDILLCLVYIMPLNSSGRAHIENDILEQITLDISRFENDYESPLFLIAGDLNARVSSELDYIENDTVKYLPLSEEYIEDDAAFSIRSTADFAVNTQGRQLIEFCQMCNLRILNGRVGSDKNFPKKTCFAHNGSSTVDLMLGSPSLFKYFSNFVVHDPLVYSDHAPISLSLIMTELQSQPQKGTSRIQKTIWNDSNATVYKENLQKDECLSMFEDMLNIVNNYKTTYSDVNIAVSNAVEYFTHGVRLASDPLFHKSFKVNPSNQTSFHATPPPWADAEWHNLKKTFFKSRDKVTRDPSISNLKTMSDARRNYKTLTRQKQHSYDILQTKKLLEARNKKYQNVLENAVWSK